MKKILVVASMLGNDGTSQFIAYFVNDFSRRKNVKLKLMFFREVEPRLLEKIHSDVEIKVLGIKSNIILGLPRIIFNICKEKPNFCLLSFTQLVLLGFATPLFHLFGIKTYLRDTIIPSLFHKNLTKLQKIFYVLAYRFLDKIICQSKDMQSDLTKNWGVDVQKTVVINNPIDIEAFKSKVGNCPIELKDKTCFTFVAAGRLAEQKGYDIIIDRFSELPKPLNCKLLILGSGELQEKLEQKIEQKQLQENIILLGYRNNVPSYLFYSDALLLSSRYEGFPNIVLEANAIGKPVFSNACKGGLNEIVLQGKNGILCDFENPKDFVKGFKKFTNMKFSADEIVHLVKDRYEIKKILDVYLQVFS